MFPKDTLRVDAIEKICRLYVLAAEFFFVGKIRFWQPKILHKIRQNWHIYTSYIHYFHHKWVASIGFVEKVPNLIQKTTMQKITEVNWKEHEKCHFLRRLPCIFSVFPKTIKDGDSEAIL